MKKLILMLLATTSLVGAHAFAADDQLPPVAPPPLMDDVAGQAPQVEPAPVEVSPTSAAPTAPAAPYVAVEPPAASTPTPAAPSTAETAPVVAPESAAAVAEKIVTPDAKVAEQPKKKTKKHKAPKKKAVVVPEPLTEQTAAPTNAVDEVMNFLSTGNNGNVPPMAMTDAMRESYLNNPSLRAARAQVKTVFEKLPQALSHFQPTVTASGEVTYANTKNDPGADSDGTEKAAALDLSQPLFRGGRTIAETRQADALVDAQLAVLATTERGILYQTAQAYMDVIRTQANVSVNEKNRDVIARQLKATQDRFRVGDVTRTDVAQSEFRLAQAEADLTSAIGALRSARAVFEQVVGVLPEGLNVPPPAFDFPATVEEAVTMAETYNPDVIAAQARQRAAKEGIDVTAGELLPEVSLDAGLSLARDPIGSTNDRSDGGTVGVRLSMPLYEGGAIRSRVREAKYGANELYMRILEQRRAAREETVRSWEDLTAARAELTSRESQVRAAEIARAGVRQEAELGQRTILDALDADLEVRNAQIALIAAKRNEIVAEYGLASAIGMLLPGHVGIKDPVFDTDRFGWRVLTSGLTTAVDTEPETGH